MVISLHASGHKFDNQLRTEKNNPQGIVLQLGNSLAEERETYLALTLSIVTQRILE